MGVRSVDAATGPATAAFFLGLLLGAALVAPVLPRLAGAVPSFGPFGPVGTVLLVSVLSIIAFVVGFATIYVGLFVVEHS